MLSINNKFLEVYTNTRDFSSINNTQIPLIIYADDIVLLTLSKTALQRALSVL